MFPPHGRHKLAPMGGDLHAVRMKLHRAQEHLETLHTAVQAFLWRNAYDSRVELDAQADELVVLAIVREQPPREWGALLGDLIHNLRSALDHLAIALVQRADPSAKTSTTAFPIFETDPGGPNASKRDKDVWKKMVKGMSAEHLAAVRGVQPFNTPIPEGLVNTLTVIRNLSNADKHRVLIPIGGVAGGRVMLEPLKLDGWQLNVALVDDVPVRQLEHDAEIARFGLTRLVPDPDMDVDVRGSFGVSVTLDEHVPPGSGIDVVLRSSYTRVLDIVNDFEARFF